MTAISTPEVKKVLTEKKIQSINRIEHFSNSMYGGLDIS